jgi:hypothetical protein
MGGPRRFFGLLCRKYSNILLAILEGFEPILKTNTQYQFFESFKTILWLVLNSNRPVD